jgi:hypothetical protein
MDGSPGGNRRSWRHPGAASGEDGIVKLFRRTRRPGRASRKLTWRERRAAERTARAEASLVQTEQRIHQLADEVRDELRGAG